MKTRNENSEFQKAVERNGKAC